MIPDMSDAFTDWVKVTNCRIIRRQIVNHEEKEITSSSLFKLMITPLQFSEVERKPIEQRSWRWKQILLKETDPSFKIDDIIVIGGVNYKVFAIKDWGIAGFVKYHAVEDWQ